MKNGRARQIRFAFGSLVLPQALLALTLTGCLNGNQDQKSSSSSATFISATLVSYDTSTATVLVKGGLSLPGITDLNPVEIHTAPTCNDTPIGKGVMSTFTGTGISVQVPSTGTTQLYVSTNISAGCYLLTAYTVSHNAPAAPVMTSTSPASPSRVSHTPNIFGSTSATTSIVRIYDDAACSHLVGSGKAQDFPTIGIQASLTAYAKSTLYGQAVEAFGNASACTLLGTYTHSSLGPNPPVYTAIAPVSPSNSTTSPLVYGTVAAGTTSVTIFSDAACSTQVGTGTTTDFTTNGIQAQAQSNATTTFYAVGYDASGNPSVCTYLTTFVNDTVAPAPPTFASATPASPTRMTTYPRLTGLAAADAAQVAFFNDAACVHQIGIGTKADFEGAGILAGVTPNSTTNIYAADLDAAGNPSTCAFMVAYLHNTIPPDPPVFSQTSPISPNNKSTTPLVLGNASFNTVSVQLYSDETCTTAIGSGTAADYSNPGITATVPANTTTVVYATGTDAEGNVSSCAVQTSYSHSTMPAPAPAFLQTTPVSPSRYGQKPYVLGTANKTITTIELYSDNACTNLLTRGSRSAYITSGLQVSMPNNYVSSIYALSYDVYGNSSACTYLTNYIYDTVQPFDPGYTATNPVSPNNQSASPAVTGTTTVDPTNVLPVTHVNLYDSFLCVNLIGSGTPAMYSGAGIVANVAPNAITPIYAQTTDDAGNASNCTLMTNYTHNTIPPGTPAFVSTTPATPSYSRQTVLLGTIGTTKSFMPPTSVGVFTDSACSLQLATGTPTVFTTTGIPITVPGNTTTSLYTQVFDTVGNKSPCVKMEDFRHSDLPPSNLSASVTPDGSVNLQWYPDLVASPTPKYILKRSVVSGGPYTVLSNSINGTSFVDHSITNNSTYYYVIAATNNTGTSQDSSELAVPVSVSAVDPAATLTASPGPAQVTLAWTGFNTDMTYKVYRATQTGGPYTEIATKLLSTTYIDNAVTNNVSYYYIVEGTNPSGDSVQSNEASVEPLDVPSAPVSLSLAITYQGCGGTPGVLLTWSAPSYYSQFTVMRGSNPGGESIRAQTTQTTYLDCNPYNYPNGSQASQNYYTVVANWGLLNSAASNEVSMANNGPPTPVALPGNTQVQLKWTAADLFTVSYNVKRSLVSGGPYTTITNVTGTSYTDPGLSNGTAYYYVIEPVYVNSLIGYDSSEVSAIPGANPSSAPTNLTVSVSASGQPVLSWTPPSNFDYFSIYRASNAAGPYTFYQFWPANATPTWPVAKFTDSGVPVSGITYYKVTANWGTFESGFSNVVSFRSGTPTGLTATAGASSISLNWTASTGATSYTVFRSLTSGGPYTSVGSPATATFTDSPLSAATGYFYVVAANFADLTSSPNSSEVSGMLSGTTVPQGLTVSGTTSNSVSLSWAKVNSASKYNIYKSTALAGTYTKIASSFSTNYTNSGLFSNTKYYYKVTSIIGTTESALSTAVQGLTADAPAAPTGTPGNGAITVTWMAVPWASSYTVLRSQDDINYTAIASGLSSTTYPDSGLSNGTLYFYKISGVSTTTTLTSASSIGLTPGLTPLSPNGLSVIDNSTGTSVTLAWGATTATSTYNIYKSTVSGGPYGAAVAASSSNSQTVSGLTAGTTYYFVVTSLNGSMESGKSAELAIVPAAQPAAPTLTTTNNTTIVISWSAVAGASTYDVQRSSDQVNFQTIGNTSSLSYSDNSPTSGVSYYYRFLPHNAASVPMAVSQTSATSINVGITPLAPVSLTAEVSTGNSVSLQWTPVPNITAYRVYRGTTSGGPYSSLATLTCSPGCVNTYTDGGGSANSSYYYVVTALNGFNLESSYSNEAAVKLVAAPAGLSATPGSNQITVAWSSVGGASGYTVRRSDVSGGPYGIVASNIATTSYQDTNVENGVTYYYVVDAVYSSTVVSADSAEAQATAIVTMNLQVPIELTDRGLSSDVSPITFERTRTTLDTTAYDGTVTYALEAVALNGDSAPAGIQLVDAAGTTVATLTIPANTFSATRIRTAFTPTAGATDYRVMLPATTDPDDLRVFSIRMLVTQVGASKTRLYIPLLASALQPTSADLAGAVATTSSTAYGSLPTASIYKRNTTNLSQLLDYNAWRLETIVAASGSATGSVVLYDTNQGDIVADTQAMYSAATVTPVISPFDEGVTNFDTPNEGEQYQVTIRCETNCSTGSVSLYKAGLWVSLTSLKQVEIYYRLTLGASLMTNTDLDSERTLLSTAVFSNPTVYYQAVGWVSATDSTNVQLMTDGTADSDMAGLSAISGSTLTFINSGTQSLMRTSALTINSGDRFITDMQPVSGSFNLVDSALVIQAHR